MEQVKTKEEICKWLQEIAEIEIRRNQAFGIERESRVYVVAMETLAFLQKKENGNTIPVDFTHKTDKTIDNTLLPTG